MAGFYYEQFEPGLVFKPAVTRTVTGMDQLLITTVSTNTQSLHLDVEFAATTGLGQPLRVQP